MDLVAFSLAGYRRFVNKTSVKLTGDMIAFVGPNEAGKSSLLRALAHLHNDEPFQRSERSRRSSTEPILTWHFLLDVADKAALTAVPDSGHIERATVTKKADGRKYWAFEPRNPRRSRVTREQTREVLIRLGASRWIEHADQADANEFALDSLNGVLEILEADPGDFAAEQLGAFRELARRLTTIDLSSPMDDESDNENDTSEFDNASNEAGRQEAVTVLRRLVDEEAAASPWRLAVDALRDRLPQIELFEEADRELSAEYDLAEVADDPPPALKHLASLAGLDLIALRDEAAAAAISDVATRRIAANERLLEKFDKSWNQEGIALQLEVQGTILHVQATTPQDRGLSPISERSDGMLWFAALLAFSFGWRDRPILLADEIETHLHYDAQADLVRVLSEQSFTSKVIYTTHSFGCLPLDLGTGVRAVVPVNAAESRLENGFWRAGAGFSPLLASMGAAAVSFTPTRRAVIAEGPSDAILLPSLFRRASGLKRLSFQIAPGLAMVPSALVGELEGEAGRVAFLVDGDAGGEAIERKLVGGGVAASRIVALKSGSTPLESEDLVSPELYARAVNDELRCWNEVSVEFTAADVAPNLRTKALQDWCSKHGYAVPDKVAVAQRVVDMDDLDLVSSDRAVVVVSCLADLTAALG